MVLVTQKQQVSNSKFTQDRLRKTWAVCCLLLFKNNISYIVLLYLQILNRKNCMFLQLVLVHFLPTYNQRHLLINSFHAILLRQLLVRSGRCLTNKPQYQNTNAPNWSPYMVKSNQVLDSLNALYCVLTELF